MEENLEYWKKNAEEDYLNVPISVLRYIERLESKIDEQEKWRIELTSAIGRSDDEIDELQKKLEQRQHLVDLMKTDEEHGMYEATAEDILDKYLNGFSWPHWSKENAIKAMEEYAKASQ
jgi:uncharacterized coiled-coil protein SlyX